MAKKGFSINLSVMLVGRGQVNMLEVNGPDWVISLPFIIMICQTSVQKIFNKKTFPWKCTKGGRLSAPKYFTV